MQVLRLVQYSGSSYRDDPCTISQVTILSLCMAVANDAENAHADEQSLQKRSRPEVSIKSDTVMLQVV